MTFGRFCRGSLHDTTTTYTLLPAVTSASSGCLGSLLGVHAMSLAFLSKKTWHVTNFSNQEAVWKAEKAKAEEEKKMEEWKKKQEEDRQIMELKRLQRESGQAPQGGAAKERERVDFLYEVPATKKEEYLLGKPVDIVPEESDVKKVEHLPGSNFLAVGQNNLSSAANEEFNKMNNDPLVAMRLEEQKALQRIMNNPIKLKQIRGAVEERREAILGSSGDPGQDRRHGKHKKEHHKHKKEKHRHRKEGKEKHRHKSSSHRDSKRRRGDSDSGSDSNSWDLEGASTTTSMQRQCLIIRIRPANS